MLLVGTERTDIAWRIMYQAMAHHLILALESFPAYATRTAFYGTEMRSILRMHVGMGAVVACTLGQVLCLCGVILT